MLGAQRQRPGGSPGLWASCHTVTDSGRRTNAVWPKAPPVTLHCSPARPCTQMFTKDPPPGSRSRRRTGEHDQRGTTGRPLCRQDTGCRGVLQQPHVRTAVWGAGSSVGPPALSAAQRDLLVIHWVLQRGGGDEPCRRRMFQSARSSSPKHPSCHQPEALTPARLNRELQNFPWKPKASGRGYGSDSSSRVSRQEQ